MRRFFTFASLFFFLSASLVAHAAQQNTSDGAKSSLMNLVGVMVLDDHPRALLAMPGSDEEMLINEGDLVEGYTVHRIEEDRVELVKGDQSEILLMPNAERPKAEETKTYVASAEEQPVKHITSTRGMKRVLVSRSTYRKALTINKGPHFIRPIAIGFVSSPFGSRNATGGASTNHKGIDIAAPYGSPIYAAADGVVVESSWSYAKGNNILIRHDGNYETAYFHMSKRFVEVGQTVHSGDRIGSEGNTGISFGAHLHFEVHYNGVPVNPAEYVRSLKQR